MKSEIRAIYLRLPREKIALLKFTIETYETLGIVRTLDPDKGIIVILALSDTEETIRKALNDLQPSTEWLEMNSAPEGCKEDWLLKEIENTPS